MDKFNYTYGVFAIHFIKDEVMLVKRRDRNVWNLPGGRVEKGEDLVEALKREMKEETGAEITQIISCRSYLNNEKMDIVTAFSVEIEPFEFIPNLEAKEMGYFKVIGLPNDLFASHKQRILDAYKDLKKDMFGQTNSKQV